ncbi:uncharacterized protein L201_003259 [Kwoniella dendrophila CBS 6074]|uniref:Uncharacterized protein n=1 Tax=Kwoniella dendrophila CBS 6074 TaxID=1295534 RepID=A0AAX4JSR7_9TREE
MSNSTVIPPGASIPGIEGLDVNTLMWSQLGLGVKHTTLYAVVGTILQSMIVASILSNSIYYYEHFTQIDPVWVLCLIGSGTATSVGLLILTCVQAYKLIYENEHNIATTLRFLILSDNSHLLIAAFINTFGASYYAFRAWRMSGKKWFIIPPTAIGIVASFIAALIAIIKSIRTPKFTVESVLHMPNPNPMNETGVWFKVWAAISCIVDGGICLYITYTLVTSKTRIFHNQDRLFRRLVSLVYETMLPPVVCFVVIEILMWKSGSSVTSVIRTFSTILPVLYYHSVLSTLIGRQMIKNIVNDNLIENGINQFSSGSNSGSGSESHPSYTYSNNGSNNGLAGGAKVFVSKPIHTPNKDKHKKRESNIEKELELELGIISSPYTKI